MYDTERWTRGGAVAARRAHNPKVVGSNPTPATKNQLQNPPKTTPKPSIVAQKVFTTSSFKVFTNSQKVFTRELLNTFLKSRANGLSPRTITDYEWRLKRFIGYPLTSQGIKDFLDNLTCNNGKWNYFKCVRALINWLFRNNYLTENPITFVETPRRQKKILPAISYEQLQALLGYCHNDRDRAILSFLWHSGCRLAEAASIKASDFNWDEGTVVVLGKGNKYRKALAGNGIVKAWFSCHDTFELDASGVQMMLKRLGKESGIHCNPHSFRRGFAVHQVKSGLSTRVVQALGGWEQISMVERYTKSLSFEDALKLWKTTSSEHTGVTTR